MDLVALQLPARVVFLGRGAGPRARVTRLRGNSTNDGVERELVVETRLRHQIDEVANGAGRVVLEEFTDKLALVPHDEADLRVLLRLLFVCLDRFRLGRHRGLDQRRGRDEFLHARDVGASLAQLQRNIRFLGVDMVFRGEVHERRESREWRGQPVDQLACLGAEVGFVEQPAREVEPRRQGRIAASACVELGAQRVDLSFPNAVGSRSR